MKTAQFLNLSPRHQSIIRNLAQDAEGIAYDAAKDAGYSTFEAEQIAHAAREDKFFELLNKETTT